MEIVDEFDHFSKICLQIVFFFLSLKRNLITKQIMSFTVYNRMIKNKNKFWKNEGVASMRIQLFNKKVLNVQLRFEP